MAGPMSVVYNSLFKRTSTFVTVAVFSAFFFERTVDVAANAIFDSRNKGKQWQDLGGKVEG
jgi:ubiquinol-cytochrome c reductase subunit 9